MTDDRVIKYIEAVKKRIKEDYGIVPPEWSVQLQQLEDITACYYKAADAQREKDVTMTINDGKTACKTVELTVMFDCVNAIKKLVAEFGLSPRAKALIKNQQTAETDDFEENFVD